MFCPSTGGAILFTAGGERIGLQICLVVSKIDKTKNYKYKDMKRMRNNSVKKFAALLLAVVLIFAIAVCGKMAAPTAASKEAASQETASQETASAKTASAEAGQSATAKAPSDEIVILYTNDVHCGVSDNIGYTGLVEVKNALEAAGRRVLMVDSGDYIQGDTIGIINSGSYLVDIMNECGYTLATIGNHEFDYGVENLLMLKEQAKFPVICCNFTDLDGNLLFDPYEIIEVNGVKLAFIGVVTPTALTTTNPIHFKDEDGNFKYDFKQGEDGTAFYDCVQKYVNEVRQQGADYVIVLGHLGNEEFSKPFMSADLIENTSGIGILLDGHSHVVMERENVRNKDGVPVPVTQTGTKLKYIGMCTIGSDGSISTKLISDNGINSFIADIRKSFEDELSKVVAHTDNDLVITDPATGKRLVRSGETNLGDLITDAFRTVSDTDICLIGGGAIRVDLKAGDISYGDLLKVQPFQNPSCVIEATGQQIADALEYSYCNLPAEGYFLQVSGLSCTVDVSVEPSIEYDENNMLKSIGETRRVKDIMIGDEPLDPERTYTVASIEFLLLNNGDGFTCFDGAKVISKNGPLDIEITIDYLTDHLNGVIGEEYSNPYGSGRINIING